MSEYQTAGGIKVAVSIQAVDGTSAVEELTDRLNSARGVLLSSSYEYPGRYTRWDIGFADPPLELTCNDRSVAINALNERGEVLLDVVYDALSTGPQAGHIINLVREPGAAASVRASLRCEVKETGADRFPEEQRSRQPSVFSIVRALVDLFASDDPHMGLYGAFGYDLAFQFEPCERVLPRPAEQRDLVLYLPDDLLIVDHQGGTAQRFKYDFAVNGHSTAGLGNATAPTAYEPDEETEPACDHEPGGYAKGVENARAYFARGDLFEVVPSQKFTEPCSEEPAELFRRLRVQNPSPYGFLINLGEAEWLVGASPEMYVRVDGDRVETCPISGTIARGTTPLDDASQILALLNSPKEESELTMCTDVDRNDKSRICVPGSVKVIGRRQIEMYSRLIHTVDHVEGRLLPQFDALDAFLTHTWAVTVTGAPKAASMKFIESNERSPRAWYGGAVGKIGFDGSLNTGLTLRTIRLVDGRAEVRVGATLLWDSDPQAEEAETELKASAFLEAIRTPRQPEPASQQAPAAMQCRILLVDHQDSFVHTLANYLRQTGAEVLTLRAGFDLAQIDPAKFDLVVLSPGPGRPDDFAMRELIATVLDADLPLFGVCLGLQGIVEYFGGKLSSLDTPMHGKPSGITNHGGRLLEGLPTSFKAGRYHSLFAHRSEIPEQLAVTATNDTDDAVMAIEHRERPIAAVQFHPESIMSLDDGLGLQLIRNAVKQLGGSTEQSGAEKADA